ncbi:hypothetical protein XENOCAPTIV_010911 [Xenoophorus captivus]|uniref:PWI domain-containing protein n=1 Tax=Xenoophorus captivus TaxID=1517983 RepID=A0ABV0QVE1_9TELE
MFRRAIHEHVCADVDMTKVNLEVIKPWITQRVTEILGFEDDVVIEFIFNQLEEKHPDSKMMQINLTGFLNGKNAREFMRDLWPLLLSAQENIAGIPSAFLEQKKEEIRQRQVIIFVMDCLSALQNPILEWKTRSPGKRERKRSPSRSPVRKPSPVSGDSPPLPLMQSNTKTSQQPEEPDTSGTGLPETVIQEASSTGLISYSPRRRPSPRRRMSPRRRRVKRKPGGRGNSPPDFAKARTSEGSESGLLPHLPVVGLCPPDAILLLSSVATAPHLCLHRRGRCLVHPQNAFLQAPSDGPPGHLNVEALRLSGDGLLPPLHLLRDTGGAHLLLGQAGILDPLLDLPDASPHHLQTAVALLGDPLVLRDALIPPARLPPTSGDSSPLHTAVSSSVGCLAPQSHVTRGKEQTSAHEMQI